MATIKLQPSGKVVIKDGKVACGCCDFQPCRDCPPLLANFTFSLTGYKVGSFQEVVQYPPIICPSDNCNYRPFPNIPPRTCFDSWQAFSEEENEFNFKSFAIELSRQSTNGRLSGCCWLLHLAVSIFESDSCAVFGSDDVIITSLNPAGSYPFTISAQCDPFGPTDFNFTVTVA